MSETGENAGLSTTAAGFFGDEGVSLACTACTASRPTPVATSPVARTVAIFAPMPSPPAATPPPTAPLPKKVPASDAGSGTAPRFLSAARWAR